MESVEPALPSECDCALCGPTDHIKWETLPNIMANTRSGAKYTLTDPQSTSILIRIASLVFPHFIKFADQ